MTLARSLDVRKAIYDSADVAIELVPNGCVQAYEFYLAHKEVSSSIQKGQRTRTRGPKSMAKGPGCAPPLNNGSTIVAYEDPKMSSSLTAEDAQERLDRLTTKASSQPVVSQEGDLTTPKVSATQTFELLLGLSDSIRRRCRQKITASER